MSNAPLSPGLTQPVATTLQSNIATTSHTTTNAHLTPPVHSTSQSHEPQGPLSNYSRLHLAPATRQTIVTTTTTETVHFAPILIPRSKPIEAISQGSTATDFAQLFDEEQRTTLKLNPKLYPLSQATWLGAGLSNFKVGLGDLQGIFLEKGGEIVATERRGDRKGKGKEEASSATRSNRGAYAQRRKSRRSRTSMGGLEHDGALDNSRTTMAEGSGRLPSPGPPRN